MVAVRSTPLRLQDLPPEIIGHCVRSFQSGNKILPFFLAANSDMKQIIMRAYAIQKKNCLQAEWNQFCISGKPDFIKFYLTIAETIETCHQRHNTTQPAGVLDINATDIAGNTALIGASKRQFTDVITPLLRHPGINIDAQNHAGNTALMVAATVGNAETVKQLLNAGSNIHLKNREKCTALIYAAASGNPDVVALLLAAGANVNMLSIHGDTPLMLAATNGNTKSIRLLIEAGSDLHASDKGGQTALMDAVTADNTNATWLLLSAGANIDMRNHMNHSARDLAELRGNSEIIKILDLYFSRLHLNENR